MSDLTSSRIISRLTRSGTILSLRLIEARLVPVEVFGTDRCCLHYPSGFALNEPLRPDCDSVGHGLMDAVQAWSDCNRAEGHIYRFDDTSAEFRQPGDTLAIWVDEAEFLIFSKKRWGSEIS